MERIKRKRGPIRAAVSRGVTLVEAELAKDPLDRVELQASLQSLERVNIRLVELDDKLRDTLLDEVGTTEEELQAEFDTEEEYQRKVTLINVRANAILFPVSNVSSPVRSSGSTDGSKTSQTKKTFKYPKIKLKTFSGELTEWLGWWAQFEKIHHDDELHDSDKFTYLVQSMKKGSRAEELVRGYPESTANYPKVIKALKERFGKPKLLKQVYVRELISMIISNRTKEHSTLSSLYDRLESHLRSLESLGVTVEQMGEFLFPMVESSLPEDILLAWQRSSNYGRDGTYSDPPLSELDYLMGFLKREIENEEQRKLARSGFTTFEKKRSKQKGSEELDDVPTAAGLFSGSNSKSTCIFCDKNHASKDCYKAQKMKLDEKKMTIKEKGACYACLEVGHMSKSRKCKPKIKCQVCGGGHHVVMCPELAAMKDDKSPVVKEDTTTVHSALNCTTEVVLWTLMVKIQNPITRKSKRVRLLLDCGSQRSYVLKKTAEELGLSSSRSLNMNHQLFGGGEVVNLPHKAYNLTLCSDCNGFTKSIKVMDQEQICGIVPRVPRGPWMAELKRKGIVVNDTKQDDSMEIELLIGADILGDLITGRTYRIRNGLTATQTRLGWCLMGQLDGNNGENNLAMTVLTVTVSNSSLSDLWNLDILGIRDPIEVKTKEEREHMVQQHFLKSVTRTRDGRYSVRLPWINEKITIPSNREVAIKRLESTTKKLNSLGMYKEYENIFKDWEREGIISKVTSSSECSDRRYFLPHRAVLKESKSTPVRPVFDASCKVGRAPSLNECLEKGPNILELIPSILLRFRVGKIGVIADIRKAFLMIEISEEDRDSLQFLWWQDQQKKNITVYRHNRVVFGVNCSPFLLGAVIEFHLKEFETQHRRTVSKIRDSLYVDNLVTTVDSEEEYHTLKEVSTHIMKTAQMELRQWEFSGDDPLERVTNVLGLKWDKLDDTLLCAPMTSQMPLVVTKRAILSQVHQVFDPLGFLSPVMIIPKLHLQRTWLEKRSWDEELSDEVKEEFGAWWKEMLEVLREFRIPRNCSDGTQPNDENAQLHAFGDASKTAYASVVFLRVKTTEGVSVKLLQSKSRVAPVKASTIPRLELLSCTITARLLHSVKTALCLESVPVYCWSDSSTALSWIKRSDDWGTFVGNRVREILRLTNVDSWRHVPGHLNPADLPSRGIQPSRFLALKWWEGPTWLRNKNEWPPSEVSPEEDAVNQERKKGVTTLLVTNSERPWYVVRMSYIQNLRILSWVFRFLDKTRKRSEEVGSVPTVEEMNAAEQRLFLMVQKEAFPTKEKTVKGIKVDWDSDGLGRVRTKLLYRDDSLDFRTPVLLPHSHPVVDLLIIEEHVFNCHGGTQFLMGRLREKCWIIQGRLAIKKVLRNCRTCQRFTSQRPSVPSSALPKDRVKNAGAFEITGIDLAGPLLLNNKTKVWIVLFTCAVYRGVHLELVESLSTEDFLLAFTRFCLRKRRPAIVYSDNGTNFTRAVQLFKKIDWKEVERRTNKYRISWKFNPPSAPWWGGFWERLIRSMKDLLKRVLGFGKLSYIQLETCLCEAEAVINNRPLTYVTEDQDDLVPLTPSMFHYNFPTGDVPEAGCLSVDTFRNRKKRLDRLLQGLQDRFRKEYLGLLVQRGMEKKTRTFSVGEVVLVESDGKKRIQWPMARILEMINGKDGIPRVARIQTKNGVFTRPLQRLYALELPHMEIPPQSERRPEQPHSDAYSGSSGHPLTQGERETRSGRVSRRPSKLSDFLV